jgi:N-acetyl-alpha-D-muramate 1-phosphate uridylyltransferase
MKAMIFAAGLGTRFKPWTDNHPKALAVVNGKSLLQRTVEYLAQYEIHDIVVNVHHFPEQVKKSVEENNGWGSHIVFSDESDELLDTGGGMMKAKELIGNETFLTINVDILTDLNLKEFLAFHQSQGGLITLAVSERETFRYLLFNKYNRLCGWKNKTTGEEKIVLKANELYEKAYSGIAIFEPEVFGLTNLRGKFSLIDLYLSLAHENKIAAFDHTGSTWFDVGKPGSVLEAEKVFQ